MSTDTQRLRELAEKWKKHDFGYSAHGCATELLALLDDMRREELEELLECHKDEIHNAPMRVEFLQRAVAHIESELREMEGRK